MQPNEEIVDNIPLMAEIPSTKEDFMKFFGLTAPHERDTRAYALPRSKRRAMMRKIYKMSKFERDMNAKLEEKALVAELS